MYDLLTMNPRPRLREGDCEDILSYLSRCEGFRFRILALIDESIEDGAILSLKEEMTSRKINDVLAGVQIDGKDISLTSSDEFIAYLNKKIGLLKKKRQIKEGSADLSMIDFDVIDHEYGYSLIRIGNELKLYDNIDKHIETGLEVAGRCHHLYNECVLLVKNPQTSMFRYFSLKDGIVKGLWADHVGLPYQLNPNEIIYPIMINELSPNKMIYMSLTKGTPMTEWHNEIGPVEYGSYQDRVFKVTLYNGMQSYISIGYGYLQCGKWFQKVGPILGCPLLFRYFHAQDVQGKDTLKEAYVSLDNGYAIGGWHKRISPPFLKDDGKIYFRGWEEDGESEEIEIPYLLEYKHKESV